MSITINGERLWQSLMETARIGATAAGGLNRLTLTDLDRDVRQWFKDACEQAGCRVSVDDMGNMFARRPGRCPDLPPIMLGSHLDTQPMGGKFDGVLGVLGALEVVRSLNDAAIETRHPLEIVNWTNEEGARFAPALLSSGVFAGVFDRDEAYTHTDQAGLSFGDELARIGYQGDEPCGRHPLAAYLELHIEQGPVLEATDTQIGAVTGVQGARWYDLTIAGASGHAGATPMRLRSDALIGAARVITMLRGLAVDFDDRAVATVGVVETRPGSRNVVPGRVDLTVDLRHPDTAALDELEALARERITGMCHELGLEAGLERIWCSAPVAFDARCVAAVRGAAEQAGYSCRDVVSGAGHDAVYLSHVAPTGMIFVPCAGGISHNEAESIEPHQAASGARTLADAALRLDQELS